MAHPQAAALKDLRRRVSAAQHSPAMGAIAGAGGHWTSVANAVSALAGALSDLIELADAEPETAPPSEGN